MGNIGKLRKFGVLLLWSFCERDGELRSKEHARGLQSKTKAVRSQSGESANTVSKSIVSCIVAYYCSVIIAASFSGFIIQLLMVLQYWSHRFSVCILK